MGAPSAIVLFGVCKWLPYDEDVITALELRTHPWQLAASKHGVDDYWGQSNEGTDEDYFVSFGMTVAHVGPEYESRAQLDIDTLLERFRDVGERLVASGLVDVFGEPALHSIWIPDF